MAENRYSMIGYYPNEVCGQVYAVGNEGVTSEEAIDIALREGLEIYQLFPLVGQDTGQHLCRRIREDGEGVEVSHARYFAARLSGYVGGLIEKDEAGEEES